MAISRIFVEIGAKNNLTPEVNEMLKSINELGYKSNAAAKSIATALDNLRNPGRQTATELQILNKLGASQSEIMKIMGQTAEGTGNSFAKLGQTIAEFARNPMEAAKSSFTGLIEKMGPTATGIAAIGTAVGVTSLGIFRLVSNLAEAHEQLQNLSAITGVSTQKLEAYKAVAKYAGLDLDLGRTLSQVNKQLGAAGDNAFKEGLAGLGIDTAGKGAVQVLDELRVALQAIESPTLRAEQANALLGGRLRELIPFILNSKISLAEAADQMERFGLTTDELSKVRLEQLDAALDKVGMAWEGVKHQTELAISNWILTTPAISAIVAKLAEQEESTKKLTKVTTGQYEADLAERAAASNNLRIYDEMIAQKKRMAEIDEKRLELSIKNTYAMKTEFEEWSKILEAVAKGGIPYGPTGAVYDERGVRIGGGGLQGELSKEAGKLGGELSLPGGGISVTGPSMSEIIRDAKNRGLIAESRLPGSDQVSTIFTDFVGGLARAAIELRGFSSVLKSTAEAFLRYALESLFKSRQSASGGGGLGGVFTGSWGGIWNGIKGLFGGGGAATAGIGYVPSEIGALPGLTPVGAGLGAAPGAATGGATAAGRGASAAGSLLAAGAVVGGQMALTDAWRRGGAGGAVEGMAGGAAMGAGIGFMAGGPMGAAIGAAIGAAAGLVIGIFGGRDRFWQEEARKRQAWIDSGMFEDPGAISSTRAFGMSGDMEIESNLTGHYRAYKRQPQVVNNFYGDTYGLDDLDQRIAQGILRGGSQLTDNIAYAAAR